MSRESFWRRVSVVGALLLAAAGAAQAQLTTGNLYGTAADNEGQSLPGVTVTVSGVGAPRVQVSNAEGQFRFLGLDPGGYELLAELEGFSTVEYPRIEIRVGRNTTIEITMSPAVEEVLTVTSESPLLDQRKLGPGTTVTAVELDKIPTARDPWALLNQAPGVQLDRVNVGGNESGQQGIVAGRAAGSHDQVYAVDGVVITDMFAIGASPIYYDFEAFEEVQLATGGTDISAATGGVTVNLVTKRGTNGWRGAGRYLFADSGLQSSSGFSAGDFTPAQRQFLDESGRRFTPNEIDEVSEWGLELGGDLVADRLWLWGAYGEQDIVNLVGGNLLPGEEQQPDATVLENGNLKLNAQPTAANSLILQWSRAEKIKEGRDAGPQRPPETTWDQGGPTEVWKLEDTHIFSSDFYLTALYSVVDGGFELVPRGGFDVQTLLDAGGVWRRTFGALGVDQDVDQWRLDGSYFLNAGGASHELRFGAGIRRAETATGIRWPGGAIVFEVAGPGGPNFAQVIRNQIPSTAVTTEYQSLWLQDTLVRDRLTVNVGLRYDVQDGENEPLTVAGSSLLPDLLPPLVFGGNDADGVELTSLSPRIGVTWALGEDRRTLVRGSYSRFAQQLQQDLVSRTNPLAEASAFIFFFDIDADLEFDAGEPYQLLSVSGFDPADPTALASPNRTAPGLDPAVTDEILLGVEHAFLPDLVAGVEVTWRRLSDLHGRSRLVRDGAGNVFAAGRGDFVPDAVVSGQLPVGGSYSVPTFALRPDLQLTGGLLLSNGDRAQDYLGLALTFTKRLADRWMARGHLTYTDWEWDIGPGYFFDANDLAPGRRPVTSITNDQGFDNDGVPVAETSGGGKGDVLLNSRWSFNLTGMVQVAPERPWGFNVAANVSGREGYPLPFYVDNVVGTDGIQRDVQVTRTGSNRNDDLYTFDLRLDKEIRLGGDLGITLSVDAFNLFNDGTVLQRERNLGGSQPNFVDETLSPRVLRLGVRLSFR